MKYAWTIPGIPPSLNVYAGRKKEWDYRRDKAIWAQAVNLYCRPAPPKPIERAIVTLTYHFPDIRRRDPDNYAGKFLLDGLTRSKIIKDDSFDRIELRLRQGEPDRPHGSVEIEVEGV